MLLYTLALTVMLPAAHGHRTAEEHDAVAEAARPDTEASYERAPPSGFDRFFALSLGDVDPRVESAWIPTMLATLFLPFGALWMPLLLLDNRPELTGDVVTSFAVPYASTYVGMVLTSWTCVGIPISWIAGSIATTNATLAAWDRAYKGNPIGGERHAPVPAPRGDGMAY